MTTVEQDSITHSDRSRRTPAIEQRGIDQIPDGERRGSPRLLGLMWSGLILNVLVVVYGTILVFMGLNWWQAALAIVVGNLSWIVTGVVSLAGPAAGTTTFAASRFSLGRNGVRPIAFFNWVMMLGYEVLDLVVMVLAASALLDMAGVDVGDRTQLILVVVLATAQALLPLLGHAAITRVLRVLVLPFAAIFLIMACFIADQVSLGSSEPSSLAMFLGGVALAASASGLGWAPTAADYSRYLPRATGRGRIVAAVALGGAIPQILLMLLGVAIAIALPDATDPIGGLSSVFPTWLVVIYLVLVIVQMLALNGVDLYSSGVTLQAIGVQISRWQAVLLDSVICGAIGAVVVFSGSFYEFVNNFLLFMIVWFAPWAAVFVVDYFLRRGTYDMTGFDSSSRGSAVIQSWSVPGISAQLAGMVAALLCINTSIFVGPIADAHGGADLSVPAGLIVAGITYYAVARRDVNITSKGNAVV